MSSNNGAAGCGNRLSTVLVTGGAGYVGSHTVLLLLQQGHSVLVVDNCSNTYFQDAVDANGNIETLPESLRRVKSLAGAGDGQRLVAFYNVDLSSESASGKLDSIFARHNVSHVIHFAALKCVSESINLPLEYYTNNICGTINLLNCMRRYNCTQIIFSSSATVYGLPQYLPVDEKHSVGLNVLNPYGRSKCMIEQILKDLCGAKGSKWNVIALRYFNPVGAHQSGLIGEHLVGVPNNLMPYISQVATGRREKLFIFGNDYQTIDGTGVRDYIHIMDLADGHLHALRSLLQNASADSSVGDADDNVVGVELKQRFRAYNLGTGRGYSVLEMIKTYETVNSTSVPFEFASRREGDAGSVYADASFALTELNWFAKLGIVEMCRDAHRWQTQFPDGFKTSCLSELN